MKGFALGFALKQAKGNSEICYYILRTFIYGHHKYFYMYLKLSQAFCWTRKLVLTSPREWKI